MGLLPCCLTLQILHLILALSQAVVTQEALLDQVKLFSYDGRLIAVRLLSKDGVPVQVDPLQLAQLGETARDPGESVVREADVAELPQSTDRGGKSFQLVETQLERMELPQQAQLAREARQAVVAQVQTPQVLETTNSHRKLLKLQQEQGFLV